MGSDASKPQQGGLSRRGSKHVMSLQELRDLTSHLERVIGYIMGRIETLSSNGGQGWAAEYAKFGSIGGTAQASLSDENIMKNRYRNIVAWDHSRVKVTPNKWNDNSDYINANYVPGYGKVKFIATQGPVPEAFIPFWQMMWEQKCRVIAMVTNEIEGDRLKCHRYWPEDEQTQVQYGPFVVVNGPRKDKTHYVVRRLMLRNTETNEEREIVHFMYTAWPDHGVPNTTAEMLQFRKVVFKEQNDDDILMIHCSAGVGRTGTFIAIDTLMRMAENGEDKLDPYKVVCDMRRARNYLVQTLVQYQFVFKTMLEALSKRHIKAKKAYGEHIGDADEQDAGEAELQELSAELADVNDDLAGIDEEVERELRQGRPQSSVTVDARYEAHRPTDKDVASRVSRAERMESLISYVTSDDWKRQAQQENRVNVDVVPLSKRLESLTAAVASEAWREQYMNMTESWASTQTAGGEEYELDTVLTPLESRILSLAQQHEAMKLKSEEARQALRDEQLKKVTSLTDRFMTLNKTIQKSNERWRERGDGLRGQRVVEHREHTEELAGDVRDRLRRLQQQQGAWKSRGDGFRGEIDREAALAKETRAAAETIKPKEPEPEPEPETKPEPEKKPEPVPEAPVKATVYELPDDGWKPIMNLKRAPEPKEKRKSHPMLDAAAKGKRHPMAKKY